MSFSFRYFVSPVFLIRIQFPFHRENDVSLPWKSGTVGTALISACTKIPPDVKTKMSGMCRKEGKIEIAYIKQPQRDET